MRGVIVASLVAGVALFVVHAGTEQTMKETLSEDLKLSLQESWNADPRYETGIYIRKSMKENGFSWEDVNISPIEVAKVETRHCLKRTMALTKALTSVAEDRNISLNSAYFGVEESLETCPEAFGQWLHLADQYKIDKYVRTFGVNDLLASLSPETTIAVADQKVLNLYLQVMEDIK